MPATVRFCLALSPQTLLPLVLSLQETSKGSKYYDVLIINTDYAKLVAQSLLEQMLMIAALYDFAEVHDLSNLDVCEPRTRMSSLSWLFEFISRHKADAARIFRIKEDVLRRARASASGKRELAVEFWCDEPIHYQTQLIRAAFPEALKVKHPHGVNLDDVGTEAYMQSFWSKREGLGKRLRRHVINLTSGLNLGAPNTFRFEKSVTLNRKTNLAPICIDASSAISLEQFTVLYQRLPTDFRTSFEKHLEKLKAGREELFLLLPSGFASQSLIQVAERFADALIELRQHWQGRALVLKTHPSQPSGPGKDFAERLSRLVGEEIGVLELSPSNIPLEMIVASLSGCIGALGDPSHAVTTVRRILGCPTFVLRRGLEEHLRIYSKEPNLASYDNILSGSELV